MCNVAISHGTQAGSVAAASPFVDSFCGVGVAPSALISSLKVVGRDAQIISDYSVLYTSLTYKRPKSGKNLTPRDLANSSLFVLCFHITF